MTKSNGVATEFSFVLFDKGTKEIRIKVNYIHCYIDSPSELGGVPEGGRGLYRGAVRRTEGSVQKNNE